MLVPPKQKTWLRPWSRLADSMAAERTESSQEAPRAPSPCIWIAPRRRPTYGGHGGSSPTQFGVGDANANNCPHILSCFTILAQKHAISSEKSCFSSQTIQPHPRPPTKPCESALSPQNSSQIYAYMDRPPQGLGLYEMQLECGPMPNLMAAQPNIGGALSESSVIPFLIPRCNVWLMPAAGVPCSNNANIRERKSWT